MRSFLIAGNWKMNGSVEMTRSLIGGIRQGIDTIDLVHAKVEVLVCPTFPYLSLAAEQLNGSSISLGAQNMSAQSAGAFTGEVAASMLQDVGCRYVILGHSERRSLYAEDNALVAEKFAACLQGDSQITPILCVGESLEDRQQGVTEAVVLAQIDAVIDHCDAQCFANAVIAYEPVWAIGTGETASPQQAQDVHRIIRQHLAARGAENSETVRILYGGSMNAENAAELLTQKDIDGGLIGGAALKAESFVAICKAANQA